MKDKIEKILFFHLMGQNNYSYI